MKFRLLSLLALVTANAFAVQTVYVTSAADPSLTASIIVPTGKSITTSGSGSVDATTLATYTPATLPVSTATQTALDAKAPASTAVTLTGTQTLTNKTLTAPAISSPTGLVKADVGLGNVDNTSDANKPVGAATQTALNSKQPLENQRLSTTNSPTFAEGSFASLFNGTGGYVNQSNSSTTAYSAQYAAGGGNLDHLFDGEGGWVARATLADSATVLHTPRPINGVDFDGSAPITVPASAGTLTGTTLASNVVNSSITSLGTLTALNVAGAATAAQQVIGSTSQPFVVAVKNVSLLTSGSPADIASFSIPAWCTRYRLGVITDGGVVVVETASGSTSAATVRIRTAASGAGTDLMGADATCGSAAAGDVVRFGGGGLTGAYAGTASMLYINQTANSANAGTVSFYIRVVPLL